MAPLKPIQEQVTSSAYLAAKQKPINSPFMIECLFKFKPVTPTKEQFIHECLFGATKQPTVKPTPTQNQVVTSKPKTISQKSLISLNKGQKTNYEEDYKYILENERYCNQKTFVNQSGPNKGLKSISFIDNGIKYINTYDNNGATLSVKYTVLEGRSKGESFTTFYDKLRKG